MPRYEFSPLSEHFWDIIVPAVDQDHRIYLESSQMNRGREVNTVARSTPRSEKFPANHAPYSVRPHHRDRNYRLYILGIEF